MYCIPILVVFPFDCASWMMMMMMMMMRMRMRMTRRRTGMMLMTMLYETCWGLAESCANSTLLHANSGQESYCRMLFVARFFFRRAFFFKHRIIAGNPAFFTWPNWDAEVLQEEKVSNAQLCSNYGTKAMSARKKTDICSVTLQGDESFPI